MKHFTFNQFKPHSGRMLLFLVFEIFAVMFTMATVLSLADFLKILLVAYGFKDIEISTYRGYGNALGYKIYAGNDETGEYYQEENCEGLMFNITHIICRMKDYGIEPTYNPFPGYDYPVKEILNMFSENKKNYKELYKDFTETETFKEVYKDKSVGEQIKIEDY